MDENINLTANEVADSPVEDTSSNPVPFKILKGTRKNFKALKDAGSYNEGTMYYCTDTGELFIAQKDDNNQTQIKEIGRVGKDFAINSNGEIATNGNFFKKHGEIFNDYINNKASGEYSHAEGNYTTATGNYSHAEGQITTASGNYSHAEGYSTTASKNYSHAEGYSTIASGLYSHTEGNSATAYGQASHAEGRGTAASNNYSHAEGWITTASGQASHAEGRNTKASKDFSHAEGYSTKASGLYSHAEGSSTEASGESSHAEGENTKASGDFGSHAEGQSTIASGVNSHAEGQSTEASGQASHAEGRGTKATSRSANVIGEYNYYDLEKTGIVDDATVTTTRTYDINSSVWVIDSNSIKYSGTTYQINTSSQQYVDSLSPGQLFVDNKMSSTSVIYEFIALQEVYQNNRLTNYRIRCKIHNLKDWSLSKGDYVHVVGNGTSNSNRKNAHTLDWQGNAWFAGDVFVRSAGGKEKDLGSKQLATTDTATTSANGLMSSSDKAKLDATNTVYATCNTAAATAAKEISIIGNASWTLPPGSIIIVTFSETNIAENPTFNVNGTGAKNVFYDNIQITTDNLHIAGYSNKSLVFIYDGEKYIFTGDTNTSLGQGYGTCATATATITKTVTLSNFALTKGGIVAVKFTYAVPANATMNINRTGEKLIYYKGKKITDGIICAGEVATFMYDGTNYHLLNIDRNRFYTTLVPMGVAIPENADLNTLEYLKVGNYYCSSNAVTKTLLNCPTVTTASDGTKTGVAFMMTVSSPLSQTVDDESGTWKYRFRTLQAYNGPEYTQYCYSNGTAGNWIYGSWYKTITSAGGEITGNIKLNNAATAQSGEPYIEWDTRSGNTPHIGYATNKNDGTFLVASLKGTDYQSGLAIGGNTGNLLWKGQTLSTEKFVTDSLNGHNGNANAHSNLVSNLNVEINKKQDKITSTNKQVVGFDSTTGNATPINLIHIGDNEPNPRNGAVLWINPSSGLKYWDATTSQWLIVPVAFI